MPINPAIALGVQPLQLADPLTQYGKVAAIQQARNQNALAQLQIVAAQREASVQNALNEAYRTAYDPQTGEYDINKLRGAVIGAGFGASLPGVEKQMSEMEAQRLERDKARTELVDARLKQTRAFLDTIDPTDPNAPQQYIAWHEANHRDPVLGPILAARGVTAEQSRARIAQALQQGPAAFAQLLAQSKLGTEEFMKQNAPKFFTQDVGGETQLISVPGLGGASTVVPGSAVTKTLTPEQARAASQEATKVAHTTTDEAGNVTLYNMFGQVIGATDASGAPIALRGKPSATYERTQAQRQQLARDLTVAIAELKDITKDGGLIDQSTGSGAGRLVDIGAGFFGQATPGAIASAKLAPIADLALKLVPRFEGPQSDKDTQSYKEAAAQLASASLPAAIRKEAGRTVLRLMENRKGQFVTQSMSAEGIGAAGGVDASNPLLAPPAGQ
jgi:hypothetical protein